MTNQEMESRIEALEKEQQRQLLMTLELIEATLELSQAARMQSHEPMRSKGEDAFKAVSRALDKMRSDSNG